MLKDFVYELVPALAASIAMTVIVSLLTKEPDYAQKQIDLAQSIKEPSN